MKNYPLWFDMDTIITTAAALGGLGGLLLEGALQASCHLLQRDIELHTLFTLLVKQEQYHHQYGKHDAEQRAQHQWQRFGGYHLGK